MDDFKRYLVISEYAGFWALDFNSPSVGCTLRVGTRDEVTAAMREYLELSQDEFIARF